MKLLLITSLWPTPDAPWAGTFVRERVRGVNVRVIAAPNYREGIPVRYAKMAGRALTARGRFDGVEAHVLISAGAIGVFAAQLRGVPLVVYAHGADVEDIATGSEAYRALARFVARRAAAIVTNSEYTAGFVRQLGAEPIINPPGVDLGRFYPTPRPHQQRVLYVGGAEPRKGFDIARDLADATVGPGLASIAPSDMPSLIAKHDILLMPSRNEPFGLVAAEAIACGRWVVAASVGGLRDIVTDGLNGFLVADGDYAGAIARVPDYDPATVAATAARFSADQHRRGMATVWANLLGRG